MAWKTSPPSLPSGVSYGSSTSVSVGGNYYSWKCTFSIARLAENKVSIKAVLKGSYGEYGAAQYYPPGRHYLECSGDTAFPTFSLDNTTRYWEGTLAAGSSITVKAGVSDNGNSGYNIQSKKLTGPAYVTKYTISYNANGGTGTVDSQSKTYGSAVTLRSNGFTRTGYTFTGWNTKADGTGTSYAAGASYSTNAAMTLYAQWELITFTVGLDSNGGEGSMEPLTKIYGTSLTLPKNQFTFSGHVFDHWNTSADDTGDSYEDEAEYTAEASATLYAIWSGTYPVTYNGNGATGGSTAIQTKIEDEPLTLASNGFVWEKHTFVEWNTAPDGTGVSYAEGDTYEDNVALVLYAIWIKNNIPVFVKDGDGIVRQVEKAYIKKDDVVYECTLFVKKDGVVYEIT